MNVFAKFDEIPSKILKVIKETKRNGHTHEIHSMTLKDIKEICTYKSYLVLRITKGNNSNRIGP